MNKRLMLSPTLCHKYILGNKCIAQFAYLKHLYRIKEGKPLKFAHALKKVSLNPSSIAQTSLQHILGNFNRFACFWPKGYQLGSLGKSHQNGDYLKEAVRKIVFPQESNLQPLDYRSTALPLELEKTPPRMLNFGYLNPATCLLYDCNNKSIKMLFFLTFAGQSFNILIVLRASGLKATSSKA